MSFWLISAALIIVVLSVIAGWLLLKVNAQNAAQAEVQKQQASEQQEHKKYILNSIRILSQSMLEDQLTLTEGAIRLSVLLDNLSLENFDKSSVKGIYELVDATAHIPILDAWKKLSPKEQFRYTNERIAAEEKYGEFVKDAANTLLKSNLLSS